MKNSSLKKSVLQIVSFVLAASVLLILGLFGADSIFVHFLPASLRSYSGGTYYQVHVWVPKRQKFYEFIVRIVSMYISLIGGSTIYAIWRRIGISRKDSIIGGSLMLVATILSINVSWLAAFLLATSLAAYILWTKMSRAKKKIVLQIASFVLLAVISLALRAFAASNIKRSFIVGAELFPYVQYKHTIVWILNVAIPLEVATLLVAGVVTYAIWSRIGASRKSSIIGGSLMIAIHLLKVSGFATLITLAWVIIYIAWPRIREKKTLGQTVSFVLLAGILSSFSWFMYDYIAYGLFGRREYWPVSYPLPYEWVPGTDLPIVWILGAAISLIIGGLASYAIWRKIWGTSQKNAVIIGNLMTILLALWMSGAAAMVATTGLLVYVSPIRGVKKEIAVQTGVVCLAAVALGLGWETAFVVIVALGLYIIWLHMLVPLAEAALISLKSGDSDVPQRGSKTIN